MKSYEQLVTETARQYKEITDSRKLRVGETQIWYWKSKHSRDMLMGVDFLKEKGLLPKNVNDLRKTHVHLGSIGENNEDKIYRLMQGESWSPRGEANELIKKSGTGHTSMSVGDVIVMYNKLYMVDTYGFRRIT